MAAQKQKKHSSRKGKIYPSTEEKLKEKQYLVKIKIRIR